MTTKIMRCPPLAHKILKYYDIINSETNILRCKLCPHNCMIVEGKKGICRTRKNIGGKLYSLVYGNPCALNVDPIEKKPLYHFYPSNKIFSLGTLGCNMRCLGCQNHDISQKDSEEILDEKVSHKKVRRNYLFSAEKVVDTAISKGCKMIAYTYNEPTIFFEYMLDIAKIAKKKGLKNIIVSNGYINTKPLKELLRYIDAANIDIKGFEEKFYKEYCGAKLEHVKETIKIIHKNHVWLEITTLLIPTRNDNPKKLREMCRWIARIDKNIPLHFSRFYPYYKANNFVTPESSLFKARDIAKNEGIKYVYVGNLGMLEDTVCRCGNILIRRSDMFGEVDTSGMKTNKCAKCKKILDGVFGII